MIELQPADYTIPSEAEAALRKLVEKHERLAARKVLAAQPDWLIEQIADGHTDNEDAEETVFSERINDEYKIREKAGLIF